MHNLKEASSENKEERKRHDVQCVTEQAECFGVTDLTVNEVVRLGKKAENRNRLLNVTVHTIAQKRALLSGPTKVRDLIDNIAYKKVSIAKDQTFQEREKNRKLRSDLVRRKQEGETGQS